MINIYDELRASHAKQRRLCSCMVRTLARSSAKREALFRELRIELAAHAAAEERYLYVPILMHDMGLNSARHALAEHDDIDELVEDLQALDSAGEAWGTKASERCIRCEAALDKQRRLDHGDRNRVALRVALR